MSRPEVFDAFDDAMIVDLAFAFSTLAEEPDVRVIVLAGAGKLFSAGADLKWMQRASVATLAWNQQGARRFAAMLARIEACPKTHLGARAGHRTRRWCRTGLRLRHCDCGRNGQLRGWRGPLRHPAGGDRPLRRQRGRQAVVPAVAEAIFDLGKDWGKVPVHAESTPGFIVNRIARPYHAKTLALLQEQAASPEALDACLKAAGIRLGPCELMELIGHDTNFAVTRS